MKHMRAERVSLDNLHREVWTFVYLEHVHRIVLDSYVRQDRTKITQKFKNSWHEDWKRRSADDSRLSLDQVPLPGDVKEEVLAAFMKELCVLKTLPLPNGEERSIHGLSTES